jgi:predicted nucleic acid-binding Zn ribbon protein
MPIYTFENTDTGERFDDMMSNASRETYLEKNPHIRQVLTNMTMVAGVSGVSYRNDQGFKENMQRIAEAHPNSAHGQKYDGDKSIKGVRTRQAIEKWRRKRSSDPNR